MTFLVKSGEIKPFKSLDDLCNYIGLVPMVNGAGDKMYTGEKSTFFVSF
jgi:transposase